MSEEPFFVFGYRNRTPSSNIGGTHLNGSGASQKSAAVTEPANPLLKTNLSGQEYLTLMKGIFSSPIHFDGKVIDKTGAGVEGATVTFTVATTPDWHARSPTFNTISDKSGGFSLAGVNGGFVTVEVKKEGYFRTPPFDGHRGSYDSFEYPKEYADKNFTPPSEEKPAVFTLRKKGEGVKLVHWGRKYPFATNGAPLVIDLTTGQPNASGDLSIEAWVQIQMRDKQGRFPWKCRVSAPGGGLRERKEEFDFDAPVDGYASDDEIVPPERWIDEAVKEYFLKTSDGHFARVRVDFSLGKLNEVRLEVFYNSTQGSHNLEPLPGQK